MANNPTERLLFLSHHYHPNVTGGGEISLRLLSEALAASGHQVTVLSFDGEGDETMGGVRILRGGRLPLPASPKQCLRAMATAGRLARSYDIVHIHNQFHLHYAGVRLNRRATPILASLNDTPQVPVARGRPIPIEMWRRVRNRLYLTAARRIPRFVAVSKTVKDQYVACGFEPERISIAPILVDPDFLGPIGPPRSERFRVRYTGSLASHKGVDCLLRAFAQVAETDDESELFITGSGPEESALVQLSQELSLSGRVHFEGRVSNSEIRVRLDDSDLAVHPGRWPEPFGRAVLEAMARGCPVLVSDQGQPRYTVGDERLVFPSDDAAALAERIRWLRDRPDLRREVGVRLRSRAEQFSASRVVAQFESIYSEIVEAESVH